MFVLHTRIILGRSLKGLLYEVHADVLYALLPFLIFLVCPGDTHPNCSQSGLVQPKLTIEYTKGTVRRIRLSTGKMQITYPIDVLSILGSDIEVSSGNVPGYT